MQSSTDSNRGREIQGYAFTVCKAAFLALLFGRYAVLVLSVAAVALYLGAYAAGVREWRCWLKPPWVVVAFAVIAALQAYFLFWSPAKLVI
ncbi:MAG TPA: hypothetical protein VEW74_08845 [Candidatus Nitrosotalea sp.]|nr:hypothetical protein [Candidatus Nitrosotalea sp.]